MLKLKLDTTGAAVLKDGRPVYEHDDGREEAVDVGALLEKVATVEAGDLKRAFADSKIGREDDRFVYWPEAAQQIFGKHFTRLPNGSFEARGEDGKLIMSRTKHGESADFEEALEVLARGAFGGGLWRETGWAAERGRPKSSTEQPAEQQPQGAPAHVLSEQEARDPARYRLAKEAAARAGADLRIDAGGAEQPRQAVSGPFVLSEEEARIPARYRAAKEAAAKAGQELQIAAA